MKIKDLKKGKYKYDLYKWGKKAPEGAIMVFYTNVFEDVYSYYHFEFKGKKCGEEKGYYPDGCLLVLFVFHTFGSYHILLLNRLNSIHFRFLQLNSIFFLVCLGFVVRNRKK
jgi:hypothetical protein